MSKQELQNEIKELKARLSKIEGVIFAPGFCDYITKNAYEDVKERIEDVGDAVSQLGEADKGD